MDAPNKPTRLPCFQALFYEQNLAPIRSAFFRSFRSAVSTIVSLFVVTLWMYEGTVKISAQSDHGKCSPIDDTLERKLERTLSVTVD